MSLNPLKSGLGFNFSSKREEEKIDIGLNPLKSGLGFNSLNFGLLKTFSFET